MAVYENLKVENLEVPELQINKFSASHNVIREKVERA